MTLNSGPNKLIQQEHYALKLVCSDGFLMEGILGLWVGLAQEVERADPWPC